MSRAQPRAAFTAAHRTRGLRRLALRGLAGYLLAGSLFLAAPPPAAAQSEISSEGPLTRIITTPELNCQVAYRGDESFEFYPGFSETGACGTFVAVDGTLFGPSQLASAGFLGNSAAWQPVSQSPVAGSGARGDPLRVASVVEAPAGQLRLEQTDSYVVGAQSYRTELRITNLAGDARNLTVYRAADCYLQESDVGYGRVDGGAPACVISLAPGARIEQWVPVTPGSNYFEGSYVELWTLVASQQPLPDRCDCEAELDNAAGLSWTLQLGPGETALVAHDTFFSPVGLAGPQQSLRDAVPDPLAISLDPIVVAQSVAIAAGVIVLVPFPSSLFNNTLEANYDRVMAGYGRAGARLSAAGRAVYRRLRARARRSAAGPADGVLPAESEPGGALAPTAIADPEAQAGAQRDLWRTLPGMALFVLLSALLYVFLDPTAGIAPETLATFAGLAVGLAVTVLARGIPLAWFTRRHGLQLMSRALPATLVIAAGCVLLSRLADFQPGYLYGLVIGFLLVRAAGRELEGRMEAIAGAILLGTALGAWLLLAVVRATSPGSAASLDVVLLETALVTVVVAGFEGAMFSMLPLRFMPGAAVYAWNRRAWLVLLGLGTLGFGHVLLNPQNGYLAEGTRGSFLTVLLLLAGFAAASVAFWAWFRLRPSPEPATS